MLLIAFLLVIAFVLSRPNIRKALPFESVLAVGVVGTVCVVLFQVGRLS